MKVFVKLIYLPNDINRKYWSEIGEVIDVKKNHMNFTDVLVRFKDGEEFEISPMFIEIVAKKD